MGAKNNTLRISWQALVESEFSRALAEAEHSRPGETQKSTTHKKNTEVIPTLTPEEAVRMLHDLANRYNSLKFQKAMVLAYTQFSMDGNQKLFTKTTRHDLITPIEEEVCPQYGFCNSFGEVYSIEKLSPKLIQDPEVMRLMTAIRFLLFDLPQEAAAEKIEELKRLNVDSN